MGLTSTPSSPLSLQEQRELLQSLRQTAFESESEAPTSNFSTERRRSLCAKEFRKLGFVVRHPRTPFPAVPVDADGPPCRTSLLLPRHR